VQASDIVILDTPHGEFIEVSSSSYNLSLFSSKAGSHHEGGVVVVLRESSSVSVGDLWPEIDSLCEADCEGAFMAAMCSCPEASTSCLQLGA
jgi:hypothetical protein